MADTREPVTGSSRRSGEMQSRLSPPATSHSTHDLLLLAAAADRDADAAISAAAADQVARCAACAATAAELRALAGSLAVLPHERPAPRDMRLAPERAASLRRGRLWRQLLRPFGRDGQPGLRPVAAALTTFGLAGLLLTAIPLGFGSAGSAALSTVGSAVDNEAAGEMPRPSAAPAPAYPDATSTLAGMDGGPKAQASGSPERSRLQSMYTAAGTAAPGEGVIRDHTLSTRGTDVVTGSQLPALMLVSLGLTASGLALFALVFVARRSA